MRFTFFSLCSARNYRATQANAGAPFLDGCVSRISILRISPLGILLPRYALCRG
jgi:hypothetical protein